MDSGGGFLLETQRSSHRSEPRSRQPVLRLNERQEQRLIDHLDESLRSLSRRTRKRFTKDGFDSLTGFCKAFQEILQIVLAIPIHTQSSLSLKAQYLLRLCVECHESMTLWSASTDGLTSLEIILVEFDKTWFTTLGGINDEEMEDADEETDNPMKLGIGVRIGMTDRVRIRNVLLDGRAKLDEWMKALGPEWMNLNESVAPKKPLRVEPKDQFGLDLDDDDELIAGEVETNGNQTVAQSGRRWDELFSQTYGKTLALLSDIR